MIKAIETSYAGYRFRSRLEARWAVFFDALGIKWEYEPEGFELPDGTRYLPDFRTTSPTGLVNWYDVKPKGVTSDPKIDKFKDTLAVHILDGEPMDHVPFYTSAKEFDLGPCLCPRCGRIGVMESGVSQCPSSDLWFFGCHSCDKDTPSGGGHPLEKGAVTTVRPHKGMVEVEPRHMCDYMLAIERACIASRSARFEHGESGVRK